MTDDQDAGQRPANDMLLHNGVELGRSAETGIDSHRHKPVCDAAVADPRDCPDCHGRTVLVRGFPRRA